MESAGRERGRGRQRKNIEQESRQKRNQDRHKATEIRDNSPPTQKLETSLQEPVVLYCTLLPIMPRACSNVQGQCLGICCELCSTNQTKLLRMRHCNGSVCVLFYWHLVSFQHLLYQILSPLGRRQRSQSGLSGVWSARGCWMVGRVDLAKRGWWVKRWLGDH